MRLELLLCLAFLGMCVVEARRDISPQRLPRPRRPNLNSAFRKMQGSMKIGADGKWDEFLLSTFKDLFRICMKTPVAKDWMALCLKLQRQSKINLGVRRLEFIDIAQIRKSKKKMIEEKKKRKEQGGIIGIPRPMPGMGGNNGKGPVIARPMPGIGGDNGNAPVIARPMPGKGGDNGKGPVIGRPMPGKGGDNGKGPVIGRPMPGIGDDNGNAPVIGRPVPGFGGDNGKGPGIPRPMPVIGGDNGEAPVIDSPMPGVDNPPFIGGFGGGNDIMPDFGGDNGPAPFIGRPSPGFGGEDDKMPGFGGGNDIMPDFGGDGGPAPFIGRPMPGFGGGDEKLPGFGDIAVDPPVIDRPMPGGFGGDEFGGSSNEMPLGNDAGPKLPPRGPPMSMLPRPMPIGLDDGKDDMNLDGGPMNLQPMNFDAIENGIPDDVFMDGGMDGFDSEFGQDGFNFGGPGGFGPPGGGFEAEKPKMPSMLRGFPRMPMPQPLPEDVGDSSMGGVADPPADEAPFSMANRRSMMRTLPLPPAPSFEDLDGGNGDGDVEEKPEDALPEPFFNPNMRSMRRMAPLPPPKPSL